MKNIFSFIFLIGLLAACSTSNEKASVEDNLIGFWKFDKLTDETGDIDRGAWSIRSLSLQEKNLFVLITETEVIDGKWYFEKTKKGNKIKFTEVKSADGPKNSDQSIPFKLPSLDELILLFPGVEKGIEAHYYRHKEH